MKLMSMAVLLAACIGAAQSPQSPAPETTPSAMDAAQLAPLIKQQFGSTFTLAEKFKPLAITADFDSDGVEDIAIVANSKDPLPDSYAFKYQVGDPYHAYFGVADPRIAAGFNADPEHTHVLLVIFGSGKDAWHAPTPKAKFALVNVPCDSVEVGRMLISKKKPPIFMIKTVEARLMESAIYWNARHKKWVYQPGDTLD